VKGEGSTAAPGVWELRRGFPSANCTTVSSNAFPPSDPGYPPDGMNLLPALTGNAGLSAPVAFRQIEEL
jgi:hypothetical protein